MLRSLRPCHGFTLIELLVVISIIAILASMLLPAVGMIRDLANQQKCGSILRQWQMANIAYASDWEGLSIPMLVPNQVNFFAQSHFWFEQKGVGDFMDYQVADTTDDAENPSVQGLFCPAAPKDGRDYSGVYAYALNTKTTWDSAYTFTGATGGYGVYPTEQISRKAERIAFIDAIDFAVDGGTAGGTVPLNSVARPDDDAMLLWSGQLMYRHRDKAMAAYWDGHVEPLRPADFAARRLGLFVIPGWDPMAGFF